MRALLFRALPFRTPHEIYEGHGTSLMTAGLRKGIFFLVNNLLVVTVLRVQTQGYSCCSETESEKNQFLL